MILHIKYVRKILLFVCSVLRGGGGGRCVGGVKPVVGAGAIVVKEKKKQNKNCIYLNVIWSAIGIIYNIVCYIIIYNNVFPCERKVQCTYRIVNVVRKEKVYNRRE